MCCGISWLILSLRSQASHDTYSTREHLSHVVVPCGHVIVTFWGVFSPQELKEVLAYLWVAFQFFFHLSLPEGLGH